MTFVMTKDEREKFLSELHVGVIGVAALGRGPYLFPVWYSYKPGGDITFLTNKGAKKVDLIKDSGRFSLLVQSEAPPYKFVSLEGPIVSITEADHQRDLAPLAQRYLGKEQGDAYVEQTAGDEELLIRMRPKRWSSADYGKG
ncbi:MAG: pyridoxamine 5'-phosphate oxidase family protein [Anaerolineales bacterium]|nr:pyridoxamine 5'-phosphate oxidase family protein [Anaerolineales bacterium]